MSIVTLETQKRWMNETSSAANDSLIQAAMDAADGALNLACQRQFVLAGVTPVTRVFDAPGGSRLMISDWATITAVSDYNTVLSVGTGYQLYPLNGQNSAGESVPYNAIDRLSSGFYYDWYTIGRPGTISVTGIPGWVAIPPGIIEASKLLAKDIYVNRDTRGNAIDIGAGVVFLSENRSLLRAIAPYRVGGEAVGVVA